MIQFFDPTQEQEIKRRRRMAEMLQSQNAPRQTEIVSGFAVPQSGFDALSRGLGSALGAYAEGSADEKEQELAKRRQELFAEALSKGSKQEAARVLAQDPEMAGSAIKMAFPDQSTLGGATGAIADRLIAQGVDPLQAVLIAKSGLGAGVGYNAQTGMVQPMAGAPEAKGALKYGETAGGKLAELEYEPRITTATESAKRKVESGGELNERVAVMPQLESTVDELSKLADKATYTWAGRAVGEAVRQTGGTRESDIARKEYISLIDNQILPLLRQTFGAQFTQKEGESLKSTLGDVNASPEEKKAVLRSFIGQKQEQINTLERQLGRPLTQWGDTMPNKQYPLASDPRIAAAKAEGYTDAEIQEYLNKRR